MSHYVCTARCDPSIPSCPYCDWHPMASAVWCWECEACGGMLLPDPRDPLQP